MNTDIQQAEAKLTGVICDRCKQEFMLTASGFYVCGMGCRPALFAGVFESLKAEMIKAERDRREREKQEAEDREREELAKMPTATECGNGVLRKLDVYKIDGRRGLWRVTAEGVAAVYMGKRRTFARQRDLELKILELAKLCEPI